MPGSVPINGRSIHHAAFIRAGCNECEGIGVMPGIGGNRWVLLHSSRLVCGAPFERADNGEAFSGAATKEAA